MIRIKIPKEKVHGFGLIFVKRNVKFLKIYALPNYS